MPHGFTNLVKDDYMSQYIVYVYLQAYMCNMYTGLHVHVNLRSYIFTEIAVAKQDRGKLLKFIADMLKVTVSLLKDFVLFIFQCTKSEQQPEKPYLFYMVPKRRAMYPSHTVKDLSYPTWYTMCGFATAPAHQLSKYVRNFGFKFDAKDLKQEVTSPKLCCSLAALIKCWLFPSSISLIHQSLGSQPEHGSLLQQMKQYANVTEGAVPSVQPGDFVLK